MQNIKFVERLLLAKPSQHIQKDQQHKFFLQQKKYLRNISHAKTPKKKQYSPSK